MGQISCETCIGACCTKNTELPLSQPEVATLQAAGTLLHALLPAAEHVDWARLVHTLPSETAYDQKIITIASRLSKGVGYYALLSDCGNLAPPDENGVRKCSIFNEPERPVICSTFPEGGATCQSIRLSRGVW